MSKLNRTALPPDQGSRGFVAPYPPSWFDRLSARIDRLPGTYWLYYIGFSLVITIISISISDPGAQVEGPFTPSIRIYAGYLIAFILGFAHFLDSQAARAFDILRPSLDLDQTAFEQARYRLTTLPARPAFWVSAITVTLAYCMILFFPDVIGVSVDLRVLSQLSFLAEGFLVWWLLAFAAYHTLHQLLQVRTVYANHLQVNLYNPRLLYSLSNLTVISSIGVILPITIAIPIVSDYILKPIGLTVVIFSFVLAVITFAWPLWGVHRVMVEEKSRLESECSARYESLLGDWHARIDARELEGSGDLKSAIQGLVAEKEEIGRIPTWPWPSGVLRGWIASLFLPLAVWMLQWLIERVLLAV